MASASWRHTEDAPLVEAILAAPDDDAPRLVYADVLSQRGDTRGELIVIQCALAKAHSEQAGTSAALEARHAELIEELGKGAPEVQAFMIRGFASKAIITPGGAAQLVKQALFASIIELVLWRMSPSPLAGIEDIAAPDLPRLVSLSVSNEIGGLAGAERLSRWPPLARLIALTMLGGDLTLAGLETLLRSPHPPPLELLVAHNDSLGGIGELLAGPLGPRGLSALSLSACQLTPDDVRRIVGSLPELRGLELDLNAEGDGCARAIARGDARLRSLSLGSTSLTGAGAAALAGARALVLEELSLHGCEVGDSIAPVLERFDRLAKLRAGAFSFGDDAAVALARSIHPAVRELDLASSQFGPRGAEAIAGAQQLRDLRALSLSLTPIGGRGATAIAHADLPHLERLDLSYCKIDDPGGVALVQSPLSRGVKIDLSSNAFSEPVRQSLRERFDDVTL